MSICKLKTNGFIAYVPSIPPMLDCFRVLLFGAGHDKLLPSTYHISSSEITVALKHTNPFNPAFLPRDFWAVMVTTEIPMSGPICSLREDISEAFKVGWRV